MGYIFISHFFVLFLYNKLKLIQMETLITIFFNSLGFVVSDSGILYTKTKFAKFIADMAVRDGSLMKLTTNLYSKHIR